jgi:D-beta-D-heptose 7-phosphate kinase/D-beta-D-heptose 1-phosphate adenosyltransferase
MPGTIQDNATLLLAKGRVGLVDGAVVRWLYSQKACVQRLLVHVTGSIFAPLMPQEPIEAFLTALEPVDGVLRGDPAKVLLESRASVAVVLLPESELLDYTLAQICKQETDCDEAGRLPQSATWTIRPRRESIGQAADPLKGDIFEQGRATHKLASLEKLRQRYGALPRQRAVTVGIVSGCFDVIHPGHVCIMQAAKQRVDILVALTMSTVSIQQQEKNRAGDRPIYSHVDRITVLPALRPVDHVVVFDDLDCRPCLQGFCPDCFFKSSTDQSRMVVQAEAALVQSLGGKTIYLPDHHADYSSTAIIQYVRQQVAEESLKMGRNDAAGSTLPRV